MEIVKKVGIIKSTMKFKSDLFKLSTKYPRIKNYSLSLHCKKSTLEKSSWHVKPVGTTLNIFSFLMLSLVLSS